MRGAWARTSSLSEHRAAWRGCGGTQAERRFANTEVRSEGVTATAAKTARLRQKLGRQKTERRRWGGWGSTATDGWGVEREGRARQEIGRKRGTERKLSSRRGEGSDEEVAAAAAAEGRRIELRGDGEEEGCDTDSGRWDGEEGGVGGLRESVCEKRQEARSGNRQHTTADGTGAATTTELQKRGEG